MQDRRRDRERRIHADNADQAGAREAGVYRLTKTPQAPCQRNGPADQQQVLRLPEIANGSHQPSEKSPWVIVPANARKLSTHEMPAQR